MRRPDAARTVPVHLHLSTPRPDEVPAPAGDRELSALHFRVRDEDRPGWVRGTARTPQPGERAYCSAGEGTVSSVHGRTGDGGRLLQIELAAGRAPFFAASSNVLLPPA